VGVFVVTDAIVFRLCQPEIFFDPLTDRSGARVPLPQRCADNIPASRILSASGARHLPGHELVTCANPAPVLLPFRRHRRDSEHWLGAHEIVRRRGQSCG
jgi:hypothetical protein